MRTATSSLSSLSLHDALPISSWERGVGAPTISPPRLRPATGAQAVRSRAASAAEGDRKSTRLNSSHLGLSNAVLCLKKKQTSSQIRLHYCHAQLSAHCCL